MQLAVVVESSCSTVMCPWDAIWNAVSCSAGGTQGMFGDCWSSVQPRISKLCITFHEWLTLGSYVQVRQGCCEFATGTQVLCFLWSE